MEKFRNLKVWQKAHKLVLETYQVTKNFPTDERFSLVSQMRRAAISVAANIAEGSKRPGVRDRQHFHAIADTSLEELKYYFILANDLGFIQQKISDTLFEMAREVGAMLNSLDSTIRDHESVYGN